MICHPVRPLFHPPRLLILRYLSNPPVIPYPPLIRCIFIACIPDLKQTYASLKDRKMFTYLQTNTFKTPSAPRSHYTHTALALFLDRTLCRCLPSSQLIRLPLLPHPPFTHTILALFLDRYLSMEAKRTVNSLTRIESSVH